MENDDSPSKTWDNNSDRVIGTTKRSMTCVAILVDGSIGSTRNVGSRVRRMQVAMVDKDLMWVVLVLSERSMNERYGWLFQQEDLKLMEGSLIICANESKCR